MDGAVDPTLPNIRPAALPTSALTANDPFVAVGFGIADSVTYSKETKGRDAKRNLNWSKDF